MTKKKFYYSCLIALCLLFACNRTPKKSFSITVDENGIHYQEYNCPLSSLKKTINYNDELSKFDHLNKDTIIELEQTMVGNTLFRTLLENREAEQKLWLIRSRNARIDSNLIKYQDFVEYLRTVESEYDTILCQIRSIVKEYNLNGDLVNTEIKNIPIDEI